MSGGSLTVETPMWQRLPSTALQLENAGTPEASEPAAKVFGNRLGKQNVSFQIPTARLTGAQQPIAPTPPKDTMGGMKQTLQLQPATLEDKPRNLGDTFGGASFAFEPSTQTNTGSSAPAPSTTPNRFVQILLGIVWDRRAKLNNPKSGVVASKFADGLRKEIEETRTLVRDGKFKPRT